MIKHVDLTVYLILTLSIMENFTATYFAGYGEEDLQSEMRRQRSSRNRLVEV